MNTDGFVSGRAIGYGLLRDHKGFWLKGFMVNIGQCNVVETELWAALYGLQIAWDSSYQRFCMKVDSMQVTQWIKSIESPRLC